MTENEAKVFIQNAMEESRKALTKLLLIAPKVFETRKKSLGEYYSHLENCKKEIQACELAIQALGEMPQYRALGTVEKLTANMEELKRWHTDKIAPNVKNPFAYTSTLCCCNCDHKDEYIEELEAEVEEYQQIGTPEECLRHKDLLDFIVDKMNPNEFEIYLQMYNALDEKGNGRVNDGTTD